VTTKPKAPTFAMLKVKSSQIESIGYADGTLAIKFAGGGTYHYEGVSAGLFAEMQKAESVGKFFGAHVRNKFKHAKI
jgi:hypothetical protein